MRGRKNLYDKQRERSLRKFLAATSSESARRELLAYDDRLGLVAKNDYRFIQDAGWTVDAAYCFDPYDPARA